MPKNKHKKKTKKQLAASRRRKFNVFRFFFWLLLLVAAGAVIYGGYKFLFDKSYDLPALSTASSSVEHSDTALETSTSQPEKSDAVEVDSEPEDDGKTPQQYDGQDANVAETLTGVVTYASFTNGNLVIRTNIDQYLASGTCVLTLSAGSASVTYSAPIIPEASTSTCQGFDIPESELSSFAKPISITVQLTSGSRTGTITGSVQ